MSLQESTQLSNEVEKVIRRKGYDLQYQDGTALRFSHPRTGWSIWIEPEETGLKVRVYDETRMTRAEMSSATLHAVNSALP